MVGLHSILLLLSMRRFPLCIQPALQDQHSGDLVDHIFSIPCASSHCIQVTMRLGRAHAFIPQMYRQVEFFPQAVGKFFRRNRPRAAIARKVDRPSNHDPRTCIATQQSSDRPQIVARIGVDDGQQRLRRQPQFIGNSDTDSSRPMIEP